jgi:GGDEF domain-containing protein
MMTRRGGRRRDQYYWLTSFLAARGIQRTTSRVMAAVTAGLGIVPVLVIGSPLGAQTAAGRIVAVVCTACSLAISGMWLRKRWPSAAESRISVVVATCCVMAACLISDSSIAAILGATTFAVVAAYTALFHAGGLLTVVGVATAGTLTLRAVRIDTEDLGLALVSALLVAVIVAFVAFACRTVIWLVDTDILSPDLEPLTGLLNRDGFHDKAATLLSARSRDDDRFVVVAVFNLDSFSLLSGLEGPAGTNQARVDVAQRLRETIRRDCVLAHTAEPEFVVADLFTEADASPMVERLAGTITGPPHHLSASIGVVCAPVRPLVHLPPHEVLDELLTIATSAMYEARRAGGHQIRYVHNPSLTALKDPDSGDGLDG